MSHQRFLLRLQPRSAFATPLRGDLLFGQLVWSLRHARGEAGLRQLLDGYTSGMPFAVIGDPLPFSVLPRPTLPLALLGFDMAKPEDRKAVKGRRWIETTALPHSLEHWHQHARNDSDLTARLGQKTPAPLWQQQVRGHNSLDRRTGTTGRSNGFAPFERELMWFHPGLYFDLPFVLDTSRITAEECRELIAGIGQSGYGKEASSGLGKFDICDIEPWQPAKATETNAWFTLSPCAPQGSQWVVQHSYYSIHVRFGRHGDAAVKSGKPWKNPLLLAETGALLTPQKFDPARLFIGHGLDGLSEAIPETVHQGYAPVLPVLFKPATLLEQTA